MTPQVSIIMPCWNAATTLDEAIQSIISQSFEDWELVAVDDGSTDETLGMLESWGGRDPRIRVKAMAHKGIVPALQRCCSEARGAFWARMDADDICMSDRLEKQLTLLEDEAPMTLCGTQVETVGDNVQSGRRRYDDWLNSLITHEAMVRERFIECPIAHPTFMASRECFETIGYLDSGGPEDYDFVLRAHAAGVQFKKVPQKLVQWRDHPGRLCLNNGRYSPENFRTLKREHLSDLLDHTDARFWQWGAGEVGKVWLREWEAHRPESVVDINPRKFGQRIHGYLIVPPADLPPPGEVVVAIAVGAPGARIELRQWFKVRGYRETIDYWFVA
jgi:glycosyltransferase involved in cell wall biosynthesis